MVQTLEWIQTYTIAICKCAGTLCVRVLERNGALYSATIWRTEFFFSSSRTRQMYLDLENCRFIICTHRITERKSSHAVTEA
jgi:hypothetical protein